MKLVIERYTREAGVRNLERKLAALARAAAVKVAEQEQEQAVPLSKDVHRLASPLLDNRLADGAEVEMEVIPIGENNHEISHTFKIASPLVVDEPMLEKVLGVNLCFVFIFEFCIVDYLYPTQIELRPRLVFVIKLINLIFFLAIHFCGCCFIHVKLVHPICL